MLGMDEFPTSDLETLGLGDAMGDSLTFGRGWDPYIFSISRIFDRALSLDFFLCFFFFFDFFGE